MTYTYAIERAAAQAVFLLSTRERRLLQSAFEQISATPFQPPDFEEPGTDGRNLLTRFFGPFSVTYWLDHAVKEVRIAVVYRD